MLRRTDVIPCLVSIGILEVVLGHVRACGGTLQEAKSRNNWSNWFAWGWKADSDSDSYIIHEGHRKFERGFEKDGWYFRCTKQARRVQQGYLRPWKRATSYVILVPRNIKPQLAGCKDKSLRLRGSTPQSCRAVPVVSGGKYSVRSDSKVKVSLELYSAQQMMGR